MDANGALGGAKPTAIGCRSVVDLLCDRTRKHPHKIAYQWWGPGATPAGALTYAELDERARRIAARLREVSAPGARAMLLFPPGLEYIASFYGVLYAGCIPVPAYPPDPSRIERTLPRFAAMVADCGADVVLANDEVLQLQQYLNAFAPTLAAKTWISISHLPTAERWVAPELASGDLALLQYTSGSTGDPKGVMVTHENLLVNLDQIARASEARVGWSTVSWLPPYHDMGLIGQIIFTVFLEGSGHFIAPLDFLRDPALWLKVISQVGEPVFSGAPNFAFELCARKTSAEEIARLDLSRWAGAYCGAEPIRTETMERFVETFEPCGFSARALLPCYGLAEVTLMVSMGRPATIDVSAAALRGGRVTVVGKGAPGSIRLMTSGRVAFGERVKIVDPASREECPPDRMGEVWDAGANVAVGYWGRPEVSADTFKAFTATGDGPFLRTGDLGFLHDGELFITGRHKDLIIIRGQNYYPPDIERLAESAHPAVRPSASAAFSSTDDFGNELATVIVEVERRSRADRRGPDRQSAGRRAADGGGDDTPAPAPLDLDQVARAIRTAVSDGLGLRISSVVLVAPRSTPKTSSGKIQRARARQMLEAGELNPLWRSDLDADEIEPPVAAQSSIPPATFDDPQELDKAVRGLLARILRVDVVQVGATDTPSALGLDSVKSVELSLAIDRKFHVQITESWLLDPHTVAELVEQIRTQARQRLHPTTRPPAKHEPEPVALSFNQEALWLTHELDPRSVADRLDVAFRSSGSVDASGLRSAFQLLVDRHESFRTTYRTGADGRGQQVIAVWQKVDFESIDARGWSDERVFERLAELRSAPFDLTFGSILQVRHFSRAASGDVVWVSVHHLATDLVSFAVVMNELPECYRAAMSGRPPVLEEPSVPYREFVAWQAAHVASADGQRDRDFWAQRVLDAAKLRTTLATDRPRPSVRTTSGSSVLLTVDPETTRLVRAAARDTLASEATLLVSAFQILLSSMSGERDVAHGFLFSGRPRAIFEGTAGLFTNIVPRRAQVDRGVTFRQLVGANADEARRSLEHRHYPMQLLTRELAVHRSPDRAPLFDVVFGYQALPSTLRFLGPAALGAEGTRIDLEQAQLLSLPLEAAGAQFDLTLVCFLDEARHQILVRIEYATALYDRITAERFGERFLRLLAAGAKQLDRPIEALVSSTVDPSELESLERGRSQEVKEETLHESFARQVDQTPDAVAVSFEGAALTYRELDESSNVVASELLRRGLEPGGAVAVCMERSLELLVALYGVIEAGGAYVPLSPEDPEERRRYMAETAGTRWRLVRGSDATSSSDIAVSVDRRERTRVCRSVPGSSAAYMLFTSGSTGRPKGVCIPHQGVANLLAWMQERYRLTAEDVVLLKTPYTFDVSVCELFWPLRVGARVEVARPDGHRDPVYLAQVIDRARVTLIQFVPSMLDVFVEEPTVRRCTSIKWVLAAGEAFHRAQQDRVQEVLPHATVENLYGPTEASVYSSYHRCESTRADGRVPIGRALANTGLYVLDKDLRRTARGVAGELYLAGAQLALGYVSKPGLTAERFVPNPYGAPGSRLYRTGDLVRWLSDDELEYLGRIDRQVKLRGQRVELGEIESALRKHPDVAQAVILVKQDPSTRLVGYVVSRGAKLSPAELETYLSRSLPSYMVPNSWLLLGALPQTTSGKVDIQAFPEAPRESKAPSIELETRNERVLAHIWQELLGVEKVGRETNFFDLGGESIIALQVASRARRAGLSLRLRDVFEHPTLSALALCAGATLEVPQEASRGKAELTAVQRWFWEQNFGTPDHWNQSATLDCIGVTDVAALEKALSTVLGHHDALRLRFAPGPRGVESQYGGPSWVIEHCDLSHLGGEARQARISERCTAAEEQLSLREGPLTRAVLFTGGPFPKLFWTTHHLVIDAVSWRIMIDQVWDGYRALSAGRSWSPPLKTTSWQTWAERIGVWARSRAVDNERAHWLNVCRSLRDLRPLPRGAPGSSGWAETVITLDDERTKQLTSNLRRAYRVGMQDALVSALVQALSQELGAERVGLTLEHHGRESPLPDVDLSRTVGWFTSRFPVLLEHTANIGDQLAAVKESLRSVPRGGIGYGLLRYLRGDDALCRDLGYAQEVTFNYRDNLTFGNDGPRLSSPRAARSDADKGRTERLVVNAYVGDGGLEVQFSYDRSEVSEQFVRSLTQHFDRALRATLEHVSASGAGRFTPSDFDLLQLSLADVEMLSRRHPKLADVWPLTHTQQGMLLESEREQDAYASQLVLRMHGRFDERALRQAWATVVARHDVLRATFARTSTGEQVQAVMSEIAVPGRVEATLGLGEAESRVRLDRVLSDERASLRESVGNSGPLLRFAALLEAEDRWLMVWTMHHAVIDGWSLPLIAKDLIAGYEGHPPSSLGAVGSFRELVRWKFLQGYPDHAEHWRSVLGMQATATRLPGAKVRTRDQVRHELELDVGETAKLRELARSSGITPSTLVHAAWALAFGKYAGSEEVLYGHVVSGRSVSIEHAERTVGPFISTLPVRVQLPSGGSVRQWLRGLNEHLARSREHEHDRIVDIRRWCNAPPEQPLFDALLAYENHPLEGVTGSSGGGAKRAFELVDYVSRTESRVELTVTLGGGMMIALTHDTGYCDPAFGKRLLDSTVRALRWLSDKSA